MTDAVSGVSPRGHAFLPVIVGADTGVYALARAFHEEFGARSIVVSMVVTGPVANSDIIENVVVGEDATQGDLFETLRGIGERHHDTQLLLLANTDWLIRFLCTRREELETWYTVPVLGPALLSLIADKVSFAEVCAKAGVPTPRTAIQDFSTADDEGWSPDPVDFTYPVIAKAANSADYERLHFPGKKKVFQVDDAAALDETLRLVAAGGFRGRFVIQEMIPGDDTQMRSITTYVDTAGRVTLQCCAHVLLEEHTPSGLGNPAAMITGRWDDLLNPAVKILAATNYQGFANFDVKVDPRDGIPKFLEVNPRIGRNNYYVTAAGANPTRFLVADVIDRGAAKPVRVENQILYSVVPLGMLPRYVLDPDLRALVKNLIKEHRTVNPLAYPVEKQWRRRLYVRLAALNHRRKFRRFYPEVTSTGL